MVDRTQNVIYLFLIDGSLAGETGEQLKLYCEAFFLGIEVRLVRAGDSLVDKDASGRQKKLKIPTNFLKANQVATRDNCGIAQLNASDVLRALKKYKVHDTFCILGVTNQDLYPEDDWNYVFGLANQGSGCGIFSFARHQVGFYGEESKKSEEQRRKTWLQRSLGTMVHEITHMFGLKHCIYFECTMNGTNGPGDSPKKGKVRSLCPVCLVKLKLNVKFDSRARFEKLAEVCQ